MKIDTPTTVLINQQAVREALDNLVYTTRPIRPSPLIQLLLVQNLLSDSRLAGLEVQHFALSRLLTGCIRDPFIRQRRALELDNPDRYSTRQEALAAIAADAQMASPELLGWGWLYYRYVRVDLLITHDLFSQSAHIDRRTLRRYQQHGVKRLTLYLIEQEVQARSAYSAGGVSQPHPGDVALT
jgi:hypothetical protein